LQGIAEAEHKEYRMTKPDRPIVTNPEAIGDPDQTPIVALPAGLAARLERTRCPECGLINWRHEADCSAAGGAA